MKHISLILTFLLCAILSFAQFPNNTTTGNYQTLAHDIGGRTADGGFVNTRFPDTATANLNIIHTVPGGQIIVGDIVYIRNLAHDRWIAIGTGGSAPNPPDSLFSKRPIRFDSITRPGSTIIFLEHPDGLVSGGIVSRAACLSLDFTGPTISINYKQYSGPAGSLTVTPETAGFPRTDLVVADTLGHVLIIIGTPSSTPLPPPYNSASQVILASYTMPALATCIGIISETVYDENTEWATSHSGTMTVDFVNTDNRYHLTKDCFVSIYTDGSSLIFTRTGNDTAQASEIFKFFVYLNGVFTNQFRISVFNGTTQVGTTVTFNSGYGFNPLDSGNYQNVSIPFSAFNLTNEIFNKIVITFSGNDLSGAKGLYLDWLQLQTGGSNFSPGHGVFNYVLNATRDSLILTRDDGKVFTVPITPPVTANNGLTKTVNNIQLGGTLIGNTFINTGAFGLTVQTATPLVNPLTGIATNGAGVLGIATTGTGVLGMAGNGGIGLFGISTNQAALYATNTSSRAISGVSSPASTNTVVTVYDLARISSGTAANGIGGSFDFNVQTTGGQQLSNQLISKWSNATDASRTSEFSITGVNSTVSSTLVTFGGAGAMKLNKYGLGAFTGTPAFALSVDASGNVIEGATASALTFNNGLTLAAGNVKLGGTALSANTNIPTSAFTFGLTSSSSNYTLRGSNSSTGAGLFGLNTSTGVGVLAQADAGIGLSVSGGLPSTFYLSNGSTSIVTPALTIARLNSGTSANGIGQSIDFTNQTSTGLIQPANQLISKWSNATDASRTSEFSITGVNSAVTSTWLRLDGTNAYLTTDTLATKAYARSLGVGAGTITAVTGTSPIISSGGTTPAISITTADATHTGAISSTDWNTFNSKGAGTVTSIATGLGLTGGTITTTGTVVLDTANTSVLSRQRAATTYFNKSGDSASYINLPVQTVATTAPVSGIKEFDSSGRLTVRTSLNKTYSISTSLIPTNASVIDTLPNESGIFLMKQDSSTFSTVYKNSLKQNSFIINVTDYGVVGDSLTDNTTALNAVFSMAAANKAWVYFPAGYYLISDTVNIPYSCKITGNGGLRPYTGTVGVSPVGVYARGNSVIIQTSGSKSAFVVNEDGTEINGMSFSCTASSPSAGAGVLVRKGNSFRINNAFIGTFYNNLQILSGVDINVWGNQFYNPINYNMYLGGLIGDEGCNSIYSNMFNSSLSPTATQLRVDVPAGIRIFDNEFHIATGQSVASSLYPQGAIDINVTNSTSEPFIVGNGIEAYQSFGVRVRCADSVIFIRKIIISSNQLQAYTSTAHDIDIQAFVASKIGGVNITNNNIGQTGVLAAIYLKNLIGVTLAGNNIASNDSAYSLRSDSLITCTNIFYKVKGVLIADSMRFKTALPVSAGTYSLITQNSSTLNIEKSSTLGTGFTLGGVTTTMGSDATGDMYYRNSSGIFTRLAIGTAGQHLIGGTIPVWKDTSATSSGGASLGVANTFTTNGALSAPSQLYTGTWITGGSATTTKPFFHIETAGATSAAWSTNGTGLGVNAATGFTGNLVDLQLNGVSKFSVSSTGAITSAANITASSFVYSSIQAVTGSTTSDLYVPSTSALGASSATAKYLIGGHNVQFRVGIGGSTSTVATAANDVAALVIANNDFTKGTSGVHALGSGLEIVKQTVQTGTATITDFQNAYIDDAPTGGVNNWSLNVGTVNHRSKSTWDATNTAAGTTGNQTINKSSGTVNIAAAGTTVTVTNSLVTATSIVYAVVRTNDATALIKNVVPAAGSFAINMNVAVTAETSIGFFIIN